jgi:hypothetical protein
VGSRRSRWRMATRTPTNDEPTGQNHSKKDRLLRIPMRNALLYLRVTGSGPVRTQRSCLSPENSEPPAHSGSNILAKATKAGDSVTTQEVSTQHRRVLRRGDPREEASPVGMQRACQPASFAHRQHLGTHSVRFLSLSLENDIYQRGFCYS